MTALQASYAEAAAEAPALRGLDRNDEGAFPALYRKGPLILLGLEERIGPEGMLAWLRAMQQERVQTTAQLLDLFERMESAADRMWLEEALAR